MVFFHAYKEKNSPNRNELWTNTENQSSSHERGFNMTKYIFYIIAWKKLWQIAQHQSFYEAVFNRDWISFYILSYYLIKSKFMFSFLFWSILSLSLRHSFHQLLLWCQHLSLCPAQDSLSCIWCWNNLCNMFHMSVLPSVSLCPFAFVNKMFISFNILKFTDAMCCLMFKTVKSLIWVRDWLSPIGHNCPLRKSQRAQITSNPVISVGLSCRTTSLRLSNHSCHPWFNLKPFGKIPASPASIFSPRFLFIWLNYIIARLFCQ